MPIPDAPELAPAASKATSDTSVDGIKCESNPKLIFHVHSHLAVFVDGEQRAIPAGVGISPPIGPDNYRPSPIGPQFGSTPGMCITWVSTRYADGLIHVESSEQRSFTLGDFFKVWGQPLGRGRGRPGQGGRDGDREPQGVDGRPGRHPARRAHADPADGRQAADRAADDPVPRPLLTRRREAQSAAGLGNQEKRRIAIVTAAQAVHYAYRRGLVLPGESA